MRKIILPALAALALALGLALGIAGGASQAGTSCVRLPGYIQEECVGSGGLYWTENLLTRQFYWHPSAGDQTVVMSFFCQNDTEVVNGHTTCKANAPGVPPNTPRWERRVISLAGGCTVYGWNVTYSNRTPPAPVHCTLYNGAHRALTATEQRSVLAFWHLLPQAGGYW